MATARPSGVHFLRFDLPPAMRERLLAGAAAVIGCANDRYRWQRLIPLGLLRLLRADLATR